VFIRKKVGVCCCCNAAREKINYGKAKKYNKFVLLMIKIKKIKIYLSIKTPMEFLNFLKNTKIATVSPLPKIPRAEHNPHEIAPKIHHNSSIVTAQWL
jgi:hypothetical protein